MYRGRTGGSTVSVTVTGGRTNSLAGPDTPLTRTSGPVTVTETDTEAPQKSVFEDTLKVRPWHPGKNLPGWEALPSVLPPLRSYPPSAGTRGRSGSVDGRSRSNFSVLKIGLIKDRESVSPETLENSPLVSLSHLLTLSSPKGVSVPRVG